MSSILESALTRQQRRDCMLADLADASRAKFKPGANEYDVAFASAWLECAVVARIEVQGDREDGPDVSLISLWHGGRDWAADLLPVVVTAIEREAEVAWLADQAAEGADYPHGAEQ